MNDNNSSINYDGLLIDDYSKEFYVDGEPVHLPRRLYLLMLYFMTHVEKLVSHDEMRENVWGKNVTKRSILVAISNLKSKLGKYRSLIHTVHGFGYKFK